MLMQSECYRVPMYPLPQISAQSNRKESQGSNGGVLHPEGGASNGGGGGDASQPNRQWGRYDSSALHIQHALKATEVQRKYSRPIEKPIDEYLVSEGSWENVLINSNVK